MMTGGVGRTLEGSGGLSKVKREVGEDSEMMERTPGHGREQTLGCAQQQRGGL